jgi:hypothetical protein
MIRNSVDLPTPKKGVYINRGLGDSVGMIKEGKGQPGAKKSTGKRKRTMQPQKAKSFTVMTTSGYWGKGATLLEAMKNGASYGVDEIEVTISAYTCGPDDIKPAPGAMCMGFEYPADAICIQLGLIKFRDASSDGDIIRAAEQVAAKLGKDSLAHKLQELGSDLD